MGVASELTRGFSNGYAGSSGPGSPIRSPHRPALRNSRSPRRTPCVSHLERRTLLSGTVDVPIVNSGFDILYQPGSTTVTATLATGEATEGFGTNRPVESLADGSLVNVNFSDGTKGHSVDIPGWEMAPKQGPNPRPVAA